MSGIPLWTTDIGGYSGGNPDTPEFQELIVRWFQFGTYVLPQRPPAACVGSSGAGVVPRPSACSRARAQAQSRLATPSGLRVCWFATALRANRTTFKK